ncbi:MAG: sigma-70 family RNA polymerase sigma factor [Microvirga sp.]|jgi:RNA polymerase sigma-70 factor (ECF subfamily)
MAVDVAMLESRLRSLMLAGLAGDAASYRLVLTELSRHLRRYFLRRMGHDRAADCEDLVQETLMALHARRATYDTSRPFTAWFHAIARYKLMDYFRQSKLRPTVPIDDIEGLFADDEIDAATARHDMDRLLETVPAQMRGLIRTVKIEGQSIADAAACSGLSESAVKVSIHRGLKALAARLRRQPE